jgi:hypothetical protein
MRRYFITLVLSLWIAYLFGDNPIQDTSLFLDKVYFPLMGTPACFKSTVDDKDYMVFVEYSDSLNIKGHYMTLEETETDTLPFKLEVQGRDAILYYGGHEEVFRPCVESMDDQHAKGYAHMSSLGMVRFQFNRFETPAFRDFENLRYQDTLFAVEELSDICYATAPGFWSEIGEGTDVVDKISKIVDAIKSVPLDLHLDIFRPQNDTLKKHPLVMLVYGGAFYFGSKDDASITSLCRHLASIGYVTASIDYRLGFFPTLAGIGRAGYRALQDAHAAMRFLVSHQEDYCIDTSMIFVGGSSSGAVTALNLAFMTNENRPEYTHKGLFRRDLGDIDTCGNAIRTNFRIRGVVEMWGAMSDTSFLHGRNIPILAFHGDADKVMPYDYDYPFGIARPLNTMVVEPMFGSSCIVDRALKLGHQARLVTFEGYKHAPHVHPKTKAINDNFYIVRDMMSEFFYEIIMPEKPKIVGEGPSYSLYPQPVATSWKVKGGIIINEKDNSVEVRWIKNAPERSITVSATMPYGIGIKTTKTFN